MIKRLSIAILAIIYLSVSSGIAMNIHYCMGKVASVGMFDKGDTCGKCGMKKTPGCCNDKTKIVKLEDAHKLVNSDIKLGPVTLDVHNTEYIFRNCQNDPVSSSANTNSPPILAGTPLHILYCIFRL